MTSSEVVRKHPLSKCEECPLYEVGKFVPSTGPRGVGVLGAKLACVGEAPGVQEARGGQPFVGPSGRLLNIVLEENGFKREDVFLTNACLCRPPDNSTPTPQAVRACNNRLVAELQDSGAPTVVALGNSAAQALLDTNAGITKLRIGPGRVSKKLPDTRVIPTLHPAAALRQGDLFPHILTDFGKINAEPKKWAPPAYKVYDDCNDVLAVLKAMDEITDKVVIDIEVGIEKDSGYDHPSQHDMLCIGIGYAKGKVCVIGEEAMKLKTVQDEVGMFLAKKKIIAQNGKFDLAGTYKYHKGEAKLWFDTMLASYCLDERPGIHGLKHMAVEYLGAPQYDEEIKRYVGPRDSYAVIPRPLLYKYNAYDVSCTWDLYEMFEAELGRKGMRRLHDFLVEASQQLMYLELNGIAVDRAYNAELTESYLGTLDSNRAGLDALLPKGKYYDKAGGINPNSPKQIKEYLHDNGFVVESTNEDTIKKLQEKVTPGTDLAKFLETLLLNRRQAKLYGTYVKGLRKRLYGGRVYTTYLLHGTTSGRLASRNPNLQNVVRDKSIRRQFVASKPEHILMQADYKQAEGRIITYEAQDEYLRSIFSDPTRDLFDELSDGLYGPGNWAKEERVRTKAFFYGLSYGRDAFSIAMEYKMSMAEAEGRLRDFKNLIPATTEWQERTRAQVLAGQDLTTRFGRRRRYMLITEENKKDILNEALAFVPQSTASDICLSALVKLRPQLRGIGHIRLTIHDALVVECHEDDEKEVGELLSNVMIEEGKRYTDYVPFAVDLSVGRSWGDL